MTDHPVPVGAETGQFDVEQLTTALRDPDPFVRVHALGRAVPGEGATDAVSAALSDDYPLVRREAVRALARIGEPVAVRTLADVAAHDLSAEVREEAVAALAEMLRSADVGDAGS
jgi:HEAT repeat protein